MFGCLWPVLRMSIFFMGQSIRFLCLEAPFLNSFLDGQWKGVVDHQLYILSGQLHVLWVEDQSALVFKESMSLINVNYNMNVMSMMLIT